MFKRLIQISCLLLAVAFLNGVIGPAIPLSNVSQCSEFGGDAAMKVVDGVTHLVYVRSNFGVHYARINPDNSYVTQTIEPGVPNATRISKPSIEVDGSNIYIFYKRGKTVKAVSNNGGSSFTISDVDITEDSSPIVKKYDGNWISFLTPHDMWSNGNYHDFTQERLSTNETPLSFNGTDVVHGIVRSNSDIWIKQEGGGTNNGWPTFYDPVYTSGQIMSYSGTPPYAQVFRAGYFEYASWLEPDLPTLSWQIEQDDFIVGPEEMSENRILLVNVSGNTYNTWIGEIVQTGFDTLPVYSSYPPITGYPLYDNIVPHIDTLWTVGPVGTYTGGIARVNSTLWIKGSFSGTQVWYSPYNIMINDDITLASVPVGLEPDSLCTDHVALISGKQIMVQYGYKNPATSVRLHPNCGSDNEGVTIYASLYALNDNLSNPRYDGCFTFEYQHPHPSIPAVRLYNVLYENIDLHKRRYPQTLTEPWPSNVDYPYYNPLWPEGSPYSERGTIHLYGSVYQNRRGYLHRYLSDSGYPNPSGLWNIDLDLCGGMSGNSYTDTDTGWSFSCINAPGASGNGIGYKKDYHVDTRTNYDTFPFNPFGLGVRLKTSADADNWNLHYYKSMNEPVEFKTLDYRLDKTVFHLNQHAYWIGAEGTPVSELTLNLNQNEKLQKVLITNNNNLMLEIGKYTTTIPDSIRLIKINPTDNQTMASYQIPVVSNINSLFKTTEGVLCYASLENDGTIKFQVPELNGNLQTLYVWNTGIADIFSGLYNLEKSKLSITTNNSDSLFILLSLAEPVSSIFYYHLYFAKGYLDPVGNQDVTEPVQMISTKIYPNPFSQTLTVNIEAGKAARTSLAVYNIKGQKINTICHDVLLSKGENNVYWDGSDQTGRQVSAGIYFLKGTIDNKQMSEKVLRIR